MALPLLSGAGALIGFYWAILPALHAFFTADDFLLIAVGVPRDLHSALEYWTTDWGGGVNSAGYYRPLVNFSLGVNAWITGLSPTALRLTSLGLHTIVSFLVGTTLRRRLDASAPLAMLGATAFLLFPLHDQAILWIAARGDLLCAAMYLGAFMSLTSTNLRTQLVGTICFVLALSSKEMAITLPLTVGWWWLAVRSGTSQRAIARAFLLMTVVVVSYLAVRFAVLGGLGGDPVFRTFNLESLNSYGQLVLLASLPFDLDRLRDFARGRLWAIVPLYFLGLVAVVWIARTSWSNRKVVFALGWVLLTLLPVFSRANSWYGYLPSVGACWAIALLVRTETWPRAITASVLVLTMAIGLRGGADSMAAAGRLSELLVRAPETQGSDLLIVNSPIVIDDRFVVVTDQSHFDAAKAILNYRFRGIPLNYAYIASADASALSVDKQGDALLAKAVVGRRTFLTLDGIGLRSTTEVVGPAASGALARYEVKSTSRAHIAELEITDISPGLRDVPIWAFDGARLIPISQAQRPR
jgi:hypothetical protein